ncbi:MAG: hypothetical protein K1X28_10330 [Parachlamydiales bacterium]|nr:hypothetical protein [Parachlamydiales bacterium]
MIRVFLLCLFATLFGERTDILFHLHDAGETNALLPVIRQIDVDYLVVASGVSAGLLEPLPKERIRSFNQYSQIEPKLVITGVANAMQGEVLDYFHARGIPTWAYWDNFNADGESPYFKTAHSVEPKADLLLLPCESLRAAFANRPVRVVGHPTLDVKLPSKVILWIGGYGKDYDEAYALFQEGMSQVADAVVIRQHHPKTGEKNQFKLNEAMRLADLVVCHQSTAAFQALAAGKRVLHVIPEGQEFDSLPLQRGLAMKVSRADGFAKAVQEALEMDVSGFFDLMGIPANSTEVCKSAILENLP